MQYDEKELEKICNKYGISYLALFGSFARGNFSANSDVDLLVDYSKESSVKGLLSHIGVAQEFESLFNRPVDLIERSVLKPQLESYINKDLKIIFSN